MLSRALRLKIHMVVEQTDDIDQLKLLCRSLIERDLAYQELLEKHGIPSTVGELCGEC